VWKNIKVKAENLKKPENNKKINTERTRTSIEGGGAEKRHQSQFSIGFCR